MSQDKPANKRPLISTGNGVFVFVGEATREQLELWGTYHAQRVGHSNLWPAYLWRWAIERDIPASIRVQWMGLRHLGLWVRANVDLVVYKRRVRNGVPVEEE